ncbi:hypothetical protein BDB01DRAFT_901172 [Pilobolus umbonatus]|nr:hypothetical protein BDB01DRAFT_901172 [Pilobolus umbonatus]
MKVAYIERINILIALTSNYFLMSLCTQILTLSLNFYSLCLTVTFTIRYINTAYRSPFYQSDRNKNCTSCCLSYCNIVNSYQENVNSVVVELPKNVQWLIMIYPKIKRLYKLKLIGLGISVCKQTLDKVITYNQYVNKWLQPIRLLGW